MNRYERLFEKLKSNNEKAFIPFVTVGDPTPDRSFEIIETLIKNGADALELGIPFSDPVADGPVIQAANLRALKSKVFTSEAFEVIAKIRNKYPGIPIGLLSYCNLVTGMGIEIFFERLKDIGVDSLLLADLPYEMEGFFKVYFEKYEILNVFIAPPNATEEVLKNVGNRSQGYIYLLGRSGVTGTDINTNEDLAFNIKTLKKQSLPILQGFGISTKEDAQKAIEGGIDGVIVGSAIVKIIAVNLTDQKKLLGLVRDKVIEIKKVCKR